MPDAVRALAVEGHLLAINEVGALLPGGEGEVAEAQGVSLDEPGETVAQSGKIRIGVQSGTSHEAPRKSTGS